ncbi:hypothetical protein GQ55_5G186900 [Panicum hallii var. hallii]|uniref:DUF6598 domain-containing protein n=1 Tax=Panicum hallii var. hallii TaxID=1504633 RepID=A0A2T7DHR9_9POAL|nr:hypothetical protein GQ55_5G186900 [Panicum hallii var. hallii]
MADDDFDGLPMYVEEDQEENEAEKQKRRQQSRKPPPPRVTPEELARREFNEAMGRKLFEYDPKLGGSYYTRVWFLDFTKVDIDEETQYCPMRYTDSLIREGHELTDSLNMLFVKIISSDVGYPIDVYGTVIIRDSLDMKCNYIFRHDRDNCQHISSHGESLILTGPSRGVVFLGNAFFEIDLKIREGRECDDKQFNKALIDVVGSRISSVVQRETVDSWRSEVELIFAYVEKALEGTIEIKILSGPESFCGKITARTTDVSSHMLLYDSDVHGAITVGDDRVIQLLRRVVSVSEDKMLEFNIWTTSSDQNANTTHRQIEFTPLMKGSERDAITCGLYNLQIKVV